MNIDQIAMCYTSMDSSQRALPTNEVFFSNFEFLTENRIGMFAAAATVPFECQFKISFRKNVTQVIFSQM